MRLLFGLKGLAWRSVIQPTIMPKPDLTPLTGGYRRIPVLQIGADVYCDTQVILAEIGGPRRRATLARRRLGGQPLGRPAVLPGHRADHLRRDRDRCPRPSSRTAKSSPAGRSTPRR